MGSAREESEVEQRLGARGWGEARWSGRVAEVRFISSILPSWLGPFVPLRVRSGRALTRSCQAGSVRVLMGVPATLGCVWVPVCQQYSIRDWRIGPNRSDAVSVLAGEWLACGRSRSYWKTRHPEVAGVAATLVLARPGFSRAPRWLAKDRQCGRLVSWKRPSVPSVPRFLGDGVMDGCSVVPTEREFRLMCG